MILSVRGVSVMDPDAAQMLLKLAGDYEARGVELLICGLNDKVRRILDRAGVTEKIGEENFYWSVDRALFEER